MPEPLRRSLATAASLSVLALVALGCGSAPLEAGACTDADPTLNFGLEPEVVDCDSENAASRVASEADSKKGCGGRASIEQNGTFYCLDPIEGKSYPTTTPTTPSFDVTP